MFQLKQDRDQSSFFAFYLECPRLVDSQQANCRGINHAATPRSPLVAIYATLVEEEQEATKETDE